MTNELVNHEPRWRHNKRKLTSGYDPHWRA